jgi:magnesium transporter
MIRFYYKGNESIIKDNARLINSRDQDLIWIDLQNVSVEDIELIENKYSINIPTRLQQEEIEMSSRYIELEDYLIINSTFIKPIEKHVVKSIHISFILKNDLLITYRDEDLQSFAETVKKIKSNPKIFTSGTSVLLALFETRIDMDADLIEKVSLEISGISNQLTKENNTQKNLLINVTQFQELAMRLRENIIDKQRVISSMLKSFEFDNGYKEQFKILLEDINSLVQHSDFLFERLDYLQNTFLGLVNIEQNKIIKIFTVISVVFMPPTLIASIYGMNFKNIHELDWSNGYIYALGLMIFSAILTLLVFRKLKWI